MHLKLIIYTGCLLFFNMENYNHLVIIFLLFSLEQYWEYKSVLELKNLSGKPSTYPGLFTTDFSLC